MKQRSFDFAILGGGCAGLSLARELSLKKHFQKKIVIIEPRTTYLNDRSWCFWESQDINLQKILEPIIHHSWQQWRFSGENFSHIHSSEGRRYCYIAAEDFYHQALSLIHPNQHIELRQGQTAVKIKHSQEGFLILLEEGSSLHANQVIDTRSTVYRDSHEAQMWQIFYGYEIETSHPIFDDRIVGLMENLTGKSTATQFLYVLPFSKTRALLELTQFSKTLFAPEKLATDLNHYLLDKLGNHHFKILRTESAALPMGLTSLTRSTLPHYHYAGITAGAIRPATGYAFIRIQQWAQNSANRLCHGKSLLPVKQSMPLVKAMDHVFLGILQDTPALGASLFQALAERVSGDSLVRFLMDEAKFKDCYQVIKALPKLRFLLYTLGLNDLFYSYQVKA